MDANHQLSFLQKRIEEIGSAIFYNLSESVLKLPTSIVSTLKVDDYGFVWFFVEKPKQQLSEFDQEFPVKLDFYKKGAGYFLQVTGRGFIVSDPEELNACSVLPEEVKDQAGKKMALVKVKIQKADCYQTGLTQRSHWWQQAWQNISTWFGHHSYRHDNSYQPAS